MSGSSIPFVLSSAFHWLLSLSSIFLYCLHFLRWGFCNFLQCWIHVPFSEKKDVEFWHVDLSRKSPYSTKACTVEENIPRHLKRKGIYERACANDRHAYINIQQMYLRILQFWAALLAVPGVVACEQPAAGFFLRLRSSGARKHPRQQVTTIWHSLLV